MRIKIARVSSFKVKTVVGRVRRSREDAKAEADIDHLFGLDIERGGDSPSVLSLKAKASSDYSFTLTLQVNGRRLPLFPVLGACLSQTGLSDYFRDRAGAYVWRYVMSRSERSWTRAVENVRGRLTGAIAERYYERDFIGVLPFFELSPVSDRVTRFLEEACEEAALVGGRRDRMMVLEL